MSDLGLVLAMGGAVFLLRLGGVTLPERAVPPTAERALRFVPVSLLAALLVISLLGPARGGSADWRAMAAVAIGAAIAHRTGRLWACIVAGLVAIWLLRLV